MAWEYRCTNNTIILKLLEWCKKEEKEERWQFLRATQNKTKQMLLHLASAAQSLKLSLSFQKKLPLVWGWDGLKFHQFTTYLKISADTRALYATEIGYPAYHPSLLLHCTKLPTPGKKINPLLIERILSFWIHFAFNASPNFWRKLCSNWHSTAAKYV